jgi:hypothetical protein
LQRQYTGHAQQRATQWLKSRLSEGCHRPAYRSQGVIGILEPADDRRNEASA